MGTTHEHQHRLPADFYRGSHVAAFTACVHDRVPLFMEREVVQVMETVLLDAVARFQAEALVYLFMPDHVHLLLASYHEQGDLLGVMKRFKQRSGFWLSRNRPAVRWQKDFYDHILRAEENIEKHVRYILANPVRAGITDHWKQYPFKGSTIYDLENWDDAAIR